MDYLCFVDHFPTHFELVQEVLGCYLVFAEPWYQRHFQSALGSVYHQIQLWIDSLVGARQCFEIFQGFIAVTPTGASFSAILLLVLAVEGTWPDPHHSRGHCEERAIHSPPNDNSLPGLLASDALNYSRWSPAGVT